MHISIEFGVPKATLYNHFREMTPCQRAHENYQVPSPGIEDVLLQRAGELVARGFRPRLDLFKAIVAALASQEVSPSLPINLCPTWN